MTEHNRKILTKEELEKGLNDIPDKLSEIPITSTYKNICKDMIKDGLEDLIDRITNRADDTIVIYSNPAFNRFVCEEIKKELGITSVSSVRVEDDVVISENIDRRINVKVGEYMINTSHYCYNSNCIRHNKCVYYKHMKGFSKPGVMINNGNSCKLFKKK